MFSRKQLCFAAILTTMTVALTAGAVPATGTLPSVAPAMEKERFWLDKLTDEDRLILDRGGIAAFNNEITLQSLAIVFDLTVYPQTLDKTTLTAMLLRARVPSAPMYSGGVPVAASLYDALRAQLNLDGLRESNAVRYGFAVKRGSIRTFPTARSVFDDPDDREFDAFQETVVDPAEPLLILHHSSDGLWYYVQARNYRGWLAAGDAAVASSRAAWLAYAARPEADYLVVTGSSLRVATADGRMLVFEMGARLPLAGSDAGGYRVELPARVGVGQAVFTPAVVPADADVSVGYLPFTRANLLRQAFKMKDTRYGWGGLYAGVDCSSFVMDVYRTFGIMLPRNADQQLATAGESRNLRGLPPAAKRKALRSLRPGAALFTVGHVVLYLGEDQGRQYVIHALPAYRDAAGRGVEVMRVVVSDVDLVCMDGKTLLDTFIGSKQYEGN